MEGRFRSIRTPVTQVHSPEVQDQRRRLEESRRSLQEYCPFEIVGMNDESVVFKVRDKTYMMITHDSSKHFFSVPISPQIRRIQDTNGEELKVCELRLASHHHFFPILVERFITGSLCRPFSTLITLSLLEWDTEEVSGIVSGTGYSLILPFGRAAGNVSRFCEINGISGLFAGATYCYAEGLIKEYLREFLRTKCDMKNQSPVVQLASELGIFLVLYPFKVLAMEAFLKLIVPSIEAKSFSSSLQLPVQAFFYRYYPGVAIALGVQVFFYLKTDSWLYNQYQRVADEDARFKTTAKVAIELLMALVGWRLFVQAQTCLISKLVNFSDNTEIHLKILEHMPMVTGVRSLSEILDDFGKLGGELISLAGWYIHRL